MTIVMNKYCVIIYTCNTYSKWEDKYMKYWNYIVLYLNTIRYGKKSEKKKKFKYYT